MIVWMVDDDGSESRWVYSSKAAAIEAVSDPEGPFYANTIAWRESDSLFADLYVHDPDWKPTDLDLVGSIWGIEVLD